MKVQPATFRVRHQIQFKINCLNFFNSGNEIFLPLLLLTENLRSLCPDFGIGQAWRHRRRHCWRNDLLEFSIDKAFMHTLLRLFNWIIEYFIEFCFLESHLTHTLLIIVPAILVSFWDAKLDFSVETVLDDTNINQYWDQIKRQNDPRF